MSGKSSPVPLPSLSIKIIKDEVRDVDDDAPAQQPRMWCCGPRSCRCMCMCASTRRCRSPTTRSESNDLLGLHLIGMPTPSGAASAVRAKIGIRPPPVAETRRPRLRRLLLLLSSPDAEIGRYQIALVRHGRELSSVRILKARQDVRVVTRPPPERPTYVAPVLISGTPKSGTTWLQEVVNAHPQFLVLHEAHSLDMLDADMLRDQMAARQDYFRARYIPWMPVPYDPVNLSRLLQMGLAKDLMTRFGRAWGADFVADRTPGYSRLYSFLPDLWEDLRIVHIVRHPLDVMASWLFHELNGRRDPARPGHLPIAVISRVNARLEAGEAIGPGEYLSDAEMAAGAFNYFARRWRREQDLVLAASERNPEQFHLLTYEGLSHDFAGTAGRVFGFLGTDPARTDLAAIQRESSFRKLSDGRDPGEANMRSFFRKGVVGDWRSVFTPHQAGLIWAELADTASALGYAMA